MIYNRIVICLLLCLPFIGVAQGDRFWRGIHYFHDTLHTGATYWGTLDYRIQSNTITNEVFNQALFQGEIGSAATAFMDDLNSDGKTRLNAGIENENWIVIPREDGPYLTFGFKVSEMLYGSMSNGLAQLYLRGNGPYEDQSLAIDARVQYMSSQHLGMGLEWHKENVIYGINANLVKVSRFQAFTIQDPAQLYTAPYGSRLEASFQLDYRSTSFSQPKSGAWYGTGGAVNAYLFYQPNDSKSSLTVQASNLGLVNFSGLQVHTVGLDTVYRGTDVQNILSIEDELGSEGGIDSLEALIGLDSKNNPYNVPLPAVIQADYVRQFNQQWSFAFQLRQVLAFGLPQARAGVSYRILPWLSLEPYLRMGGFTLVDAGISASAHLNNALRLFINYELLESQIAPQASTGQGLFVAGQIRF